MAYYSGTANDLTALRQALIDACGLEGWSWNGTTEVLSKGTMFLRLQIVSGYLTLLGRTSATAGDAPDVVRIGQLGSTPLAYPLTYEIFAFAGEVYLVVNYSVDYYQWCAFGDSTVQGLPGSGMWVGASIGSSAASSGVTIDAAYGGAGSSTTTAALFWGTNAVSGANRNAWLHSDLDAQGWWLAQTLTGESIGVKASVPLIGLLPNAWNSEAVLLPIRTWKIRPSNKLSLIADLENARYTRVDNYTPGEIVTLGSDRWKIFPWYRKDAANRNGGSSHTGTFGWALRYEGP
ncbi:hypothetical protein [Azotobacter beijerinckii]|uniref:Uncharacterized protein n=1 Tax=Azotobacter beijerinckii TaxID=170623 RepID=A0A1I3ZMB9_9GAMM|nr:hypothetical protein [Azotobacter beijerinckii]SFB48389.1 hypothetical protein SAMN04244571_03127 [Azotobacter beijerinckii]SFK45147.1 hypothetical protein SAMN04244574_00660 [Azotobacter beijerinckii]